jgi:hypothetical protein
LRWIEQPVTGIPGVNLKGSKTAKTREEIYKIFAFLHVLCVLAVQVFQPESQVSPATGFAGLNNLWLEQGLTTKRICRRCMLIYADRILNCRRTSA